MKLAAAILLLLLGNCIRGQDRKIDLYLLPGLAADHRSFKNLSLDPAFYRLRYIHYPTPSPFETMSSYAIRLIDQIDTSGQFVLVGVSLGGMLAVELSEVLQPTKVFIIASACSKHDLPPRYTIQRKIPINRMAPQWIFKYGTFVAQPLFEPDRALEKETCLAMIHDKDPMFMKRAVDMIIHWDRKICPLNIIHIHGTKDHTLPIRHSSPDIVLEGASHMMIMTAANEVTRIIEKALKTHSKIE